MLLASWLVGKLRVFCLGLIYEFYCGPKLCVLCAASHRGQLAGWMAVSAALLVPFFYVYVYAWQNQGLREFLRNTPFVIFLVLHVAHRDLRLFNVFVSFAFLLQPNRAVSHSVANHQNHWQRVLWGRKVRKRANNFYKLQVPF